MKLFSLLLATIYLLPSSGMAQGTIQRGAEFQINLIGGPANPWGAKARDADHATVAMNDSGDVVIAYHTTRDDFSPSLKQVEVAYFGFTAGATPAQDTWTLIDQVLLGSVGHSPLSGQYLQLNVKCERPDVVAVGDKFFVVWTRRYDRAYNPTSQALPPQWQEPAVLEGAWLERSGTSVNVYGPLSSGLGFRLDQNYFIRECAGVPDAVVLKQPAGGNPTVGIVYPRQVDFSHDPGPPVSEDDTRIFELALVTCSIDGSNQVTSQPPMVLPAQVPYDGDSGGAAGLVLPDLAPSSEENAFWVTFEGQQVVGTDVLGAIRLEYWVLNGSTVPEFSKSFKTTTAVGSAFRRRPMISSLPGDTPSEMVSIAFLKVAPSPASDKDVVYEQWQYENGSFFRAPIPLGHAFQNSSSDEGKAVPLHGPTPSYLRRCYFNRSGILYYDMNSNQETTVSPSITASRPAVSFNQPNGTESVALVWEDLLYPAGINAYKRIVLRMD